MIKANEIWLNQEVKLIYIYNSWGIIYSWYKEDQQRGGNSAARHAGRQASGRVRGSCLQLRVCLRREFTVCLFSRLLFAHTLSREKRHPELPDNVSLLSRSTIVLSFFWGFLSVWFPKHKSHQKQRQTWSGAANWKSRRPPTPFCIQILWILKVPKVIRVSSEWGS